MLPPEAEYLQTQIINHLQLFFKAKARVCFDSGMIKFVPQDELNNANKKQVLIPYDIALPERPLSPYKVEFNNTNLTLWNRVPMPNRGNWRALPNDSAPLWYENEHGALTPAYNLFGNLFELLTFGEERKSTQRDQHGRFSAYHSPRLENDLLEVPAFNEAVAAILGACLGIKHKTQPLFDLNNMNKPPVLVLSHDCDVLLGHDFWSQIVRAYRIGLPLAKFKLPKFGNLWWIIRNAITPRRFYFDNCTGMADIERCFGYDSTYYMLNGNGGRFGARNNFRIVPKLLDALPPGHDIGLHYNYDTFLNHELFKKQLDELQSAVNSKLVVGRAHYLRFDPQQSFSFLEQYGIYADESSGYGDRVGYRNGIAGCFQAFDPARKKTHDVWEIPLTIMDAVLVRQYQDQAMNVFSSHLNHLGCIGGAMSIVFHPGLFFNPEHREMLGVYHQMLIAARDIGATSSTARMMVEQIHNR